MSKKLKKFFKSTSISHQLLGKDDKKEKAAAPVEAAAPAPAAQVVEAPKEDTTEVDDSSESAKKAARSRGKRGLSVARSSGSGLNI